MARSGINGSGVQLNVVYFNLGSNLPSLEKAISQENIWHRRQPFLSPSNLKAQEEGMYE